MGAIYKKPLAWHTVTVYHKFTSENKKPGSFLTKGCGGGGWQGLLHGPGTVYGFFAAQVKENIIHINNKPIIAIFKFYAVGFSDVILVVVHIIRGCHGKQYQEILSDYLQILNLNMYSSVLYRVYFKKRRKRRGHQIGSYCAAKSFSKFNKNIVMRGLNICVIGEGAE